MNVATRRHAKKTSVAVEQSEGFTVDTSSDDSSKHQSSGPQALFLVKNQRRLFVLVLILACTILFSTIVWWDIHLRPLQQRKADQMNKARNSQQTQQLSSILHDEFSIRTSSPRVNDSSSCSAARYSFLFPEHGCLDNEVAGRVHCRFRNLRIDLTKVHAKRVGGESLASSMGQAESDEFLSYETGAFVVREPLKETTATVPSTEELRYKKYWHYLHDVSDALVVDSKNATGQNDIPIKCDQTWPGVTLFITRYEYVNLYHTMTDWWNTYFAMTAAVNHHHHHHHDGNKNSRRVNIVFLDAHPAGNLDPVWEQLFGQVSFLRRLPGNHVCFEEARFVPAGYTSPIYPKDSEPCPPDPEYTRHFVNHVLSAYNLTHVRRIPGHVVAIERVPYISHPRSKPGNTERLLSNLRHLAMMLPKTLIAQRQQLEQEQHGNGKNLLSFFSKPSSSTTTFPRVTINVVTLVNDTMRDQIAAIRQAHVLLANHGAGLTHLLFLDNGAHVIELNCNHGFFVQLARWRGGGLGDKLRHYCQGFVDTGETISERFWKDNVEWVIANRVFASTAASST
jgi:Glycosyltransferase 61